MKFINTALGFALLAIGCTFSYAAGPDCTKASNKVEVLICEDPELSALDDKVGVAYEAALKDATHSSLVKKIHAVWLQARTENGLGCDRQQDVSGCMKFAYREYLSWLKFPFLKIKQIDFTEPVGRYVTRLADGTVLLWSDSAGYIFDPQLGRFSITSPPVIKGRSGFVYLPISDGKILVAGGSRVESVNGNERFVSAPEMELYDPASRKFSVVGKLPMLPGSITLLDDNKVLIAGGDMAEPTSGAVVYDINKLRVLQRSRLITPRANHTATKMLDGRILIAGGVEGGAASVNAEILDPISGGTTLTGIPIHNRHHHAAILLPSGNVLLAGGVQSGVPKPLYESLDIMTSAEIYDPATGRFTETGKLHTANLSPTLLLLPSHKVLSVGLVIPKSGLSWTSLEIYDPDTMEFSPVGKVAYPATVIPLGNSQLLIVGQGHIGIIDLH